QSNRDRADLVALRRLDSVEDCARVVEFLTTDLSDYVTGAVIPIDGGLASATPQQPNRTISAFISGSRVRNSQTVSLASASTSGFCPPYRSETVSRLCPLMISQMSLGIGEWRASSTHVCRSSWITR